MYVLKSEKRYVVYTYPHEVQMSLWILGCLKILHDLQNCLNLNINKFTSPHSQLALSKQKLWQPWGLFPHGNNRVKFNSSAYLWMRQEFPVYPSPHHSLLPHALSTYPLLPPPKHLIIRP